MTFKRKEVKLIITGAAKESYEYLNKIVGNELENGITSSFNQTLFNAIKQKIELLRQNPQYGIHVLKDRIPKDYLITYDVNNIWKINLPKAWRMIYTLRGSEIEILTIILDIFDLKEYNKKFGYKS